MGIKSIRFYCSYLYIAQSILFIKVIWEFLGRSPKTYILITLISIPPKNLLLKQYYFSEGLIV
jgi:hypothetical protein